MTLWLTIIASGGVTYAIRLSFIVLLGRVALPEVLRRGLRFVPPAVLAAIILPELVLRQGRLDLAPTNPRLLAGLLAGVIAWRTRNVLLTIGVGMAGLWLLQALVR